MKVLSVPVRVRIVQLLRSLSYALPLTYGADPLHGSIHRMPNLPLALDFGMLVMFCILLFAFSLRNVRRKWSA